MVRDDQEPELKEMSNYQLIGDCYARSHSFDEPPSSQTEASDNLEDKSLSKRTALLLHDLSQEILRPLRIEDFGLCKTVRAHSMSAVRFASSTIFRTGTYEYMDFSRIETRQSHTFLRFNPTIDRTFSDCLIRSLRRYANPRTLVRKRIRAGMIYRPLLGKEIRLLKLLPGSAIDRISCELEIRRLIDCPNYEAVSYVWGESLDTVEILVNDAELYITRNLYNALQVFRYKDRPRLLWIDAICINQSDLSEKSRQIVLMKDVYSRCKACNVWLGRVDDPGLFTARPLLAPQSLEEVLALECVSAVPDVESVVRLFRLLQCLAVMDSGKRVDLSVYPGRSIINGSGELETLALDIVSALRSERTLSSLINIMSRPWWTRIWTVQEAVLPTRSGRKVMIYLGSEAIDFDLFLIAVSEWFGRSLYTLQNWTAPSTLDALLDATQVILSPLGSLSMLVKPGQGPFRMDQTLFLHLLALEDRVCKIPHDAVYGLLALFENPLSLTRPDYSQSVRQCYNSATRAIMTRTCTLDHLEFASPSRSAFGLPSWVIDFQRGPPFRGLVRAENTRSARMRDGTPWSHRTYVLDDDAELQDVLSIRVYFLTSIDKVLPSSIWAQNSDSWLEMLSTWHKAARATESSDYNFLATLFPIDRSQFESAGLDVDTISKEVNLDNLNSLADCSSWIGLSRNQASEKASARTSAKMENIMQRTVQVNLAAMQVNKLAFITTRDGWIATASEAAQTGDTVVLLEGARLPVVLRPVTELEVKQSGSHSSEKSYQFISSCYSAKSLDLRNVDDAQRVDIDLV